MSLLNESHVCTCNGAAQIEDARMGSARIPTVACA